VRQCCRLLHRSDRIGSDPILSQSIPGGSIDGSDRSPYPRSGCFSTFEWGMGYRGNTKGGRHVAIVWGALILIIIINIGCSSPKSRKSLALGACLYVKLFLIMQQQRQQQQQLQQQQLRQQHQQEQQQQQSKLVGQQ